MKTKQRIFAALMAIAFLFTNVVGAMAALGKLHRYSASEVKIYWTETAGGKTTTSVVNGNYFTISDEVAYCFDHGYEASVPGVQYDKVVNNMSEANKNRVRTLLIYGYPNAKIGNKPLGFSFDSNNHLRMGTQIALWRLMKDIGSPSAKGKIFAFSGTKSYYNKSKSNSKLADKIVDYAKALYNKAKAGKSAIAWNKIDASKVVKKTVTNSPLKGTVYRKGPYKVVAKDPAAQFTVKLFKGTKTSTTAADSSRAVIVDANQKKVSTSAKLSNGDKIYVDITKVDANNKQKYTIKQTATSSTKKLDYEIYKCNYEYWHD